MSRVIAQFSCGAASAVATKLALAQHGDNCILLNAFIANEHADNRRFLAQCEEWFGRTATVLRDTKYNADAVQVFHAVGFIKSRNGASCSTRIKRQLLRSFEQPGDVLVLGYTAEEQDRLDDWREAFPDRPIITPLIERGLTKEDCKAMVLRAGIRLPRMYELGYDNANCIGCIKGGMGYWRGIREDFPAEFERVAAAEEYVASLHGENAYLFRHRSGPLKGQRFPLRLLPDGPIVRNEHVPACGLFCESSEQEYSA